MPKIYLSDKQLPAIPSDQVLAELLEMTKRATPGKRRIVDLAGNTDRPFAFNLRTELGNMPLGRDDAELAATLTPELVRGLLYKISLLEDARDQACHLAQDALGDKVTAVQAARINRLLEAGKASGE